MYRIILLLLLTQIYTNAAQAAKPAPAAPPPPRPPATNSGGAVASSIGSDSGGAGGDEQFHEQLSSSMQKTEKSIKLLRKQVTESQVAPFLPDLYLQLADLLSQKAVTLYYIQMEKEQKIDTNTPLSKQATPVIQAQKEAISVYNTILHDFPDFNKKAEVLYKLAVSLKAIDQIPEFIKTVSILTHDYSKTEEAMRASLLLAQHFFDNHEYEDSYKLFLDISKTTYTYERNLAKYRIALIYLAEEKYLDSLHMFEVVINDPELKEQDDPYNISKKTHPGKSDLKREALIDSIRAYTQIYTNNPDPVPYYSKLAPSETHFQEVMEKLALRYIFLKKYDTSITLLRTLSERTADPQKVLNIYREVLLMIPLNSRIKIPIEEMRFVLSKFNLWWAFYSTSSAQLGSAYWFFEKQIRDLGTNSQALSKVERNPQLRTFYLERARDFYLLYLSYFDKSPYAVKIATNIADAYYSLKDYFDSGDYYLRVFQGEFNTPPLSDRRALIENAILVLQKDAPGTFYERVRMKGLLMKAVERYFVMYPQLRNDPKLNLVILKAHYEQGFFPETLDELYAFIKRYIRTPQAKDAGELILDYFNTKNDFTGLEFWAGRLLSLKIPDPNFNLKLSQVKQQAKAKVIQEKVKEVSGYDEFSQGKSYLTAALNSSDALLKNQALQQALAQSKSEHDIQTFLAAATLMANKETDKQKKSEIFRSLAVENMKLGRYYKGLATLRDVMNDSGTDAKSRASALEDFLNAAIQLKDSQALEEGISNSLITRTSPAIQSRVREQITDMLDSPQDVSANLVSGLFRMGLTEENLLSLYKAKFKLSSSVVGRIQSEVQSRCAGGSRTSYCRWASLEAMDPGKLKALSYLSRAPTDLKSIETSAGYFMNVVSKFQTLEGSEDPHLETAVSIENKALYNAFANYLMRVANANPALKADLMAKARESYGNAQREQQKCDIIHQRAASANPAFKYCDIPQVPAFQDLLIWRGPAPQSATTADLNTPEINTLQKAVFAPKGDPASLLRLVMEFYKAGALHHSGALSSYGMSTFQSNEADFKAILGCSALKLGFYNEAAYHLKTASDYGNLKAGCNAQLAQIRGGPAR